MSRRVIGALGAVVVCGVGIYAAARSGGEPQTPPPPPRQQAPASAAEAQTLAEFQARVTAYVAMRDKVQSTLPKQAEESTPEDIHARQVRLETGIREARGQSAQGDIFGPDMERLVRARLRQAFARDKPDELRASILDENPTGIKFNLNHRYPDEVPMSTMPPQVLEALPELPEGLEFRFVGENLVLLDVDSHAIVDFVPDALPTVTP